MSTALMPPPGLNLDAKRIAATSAAIAVHLFALMLLLAPVRWSPPAAPIDVDDQVPLVDQILLPPPPPPPPADPIREISHAPPHPTAAPPLMPQLDTAPIDTVLPASDPQATDEGDDGAGSDVVEPFPTGPQELAVRLGPAPTYPIQALRDGIEGRVVLVIEVDASGMPTGGHIESSSGSTLLDRAALKFVLAKWRFVPAMHAGQPIATSARVPVEFVINE